MTFLKIMLFCVLVLLIYIGVLYLIQDRLIFFPERKYVSPEEAKTPDFQEMPLKMSDGAIIMTWYAKGNSEKPAILFLHGNAGQNATFAPHVQTYVDKGYPLMIMEYRGYGNTAGHLTQEAVFKDASTCYEALKKMGHKRIVVFGYSLGTGVASGLLQYQMPDGLILLAPFYSLHQIVVEKPFPFAQFLLKNPFRSDLSLPKLMAPLLLIHGEEDPLIPVAHGRKLLARATGKDAQGVFLEGQTHASVFFEHASQGIILDWLKSRFPNQK